MVKLTEIQKKLYLEHRGLRCPVCESSQIDGQGIEFDSEDIATEEVICLKCGSGWTDTYAITNVELTNIGKIK
jgi:hypothetical protein